MSYAYSLISRFLDDIHRPFSLIMTIGSVVLTSSISIGAILAFDIYPISSAFSLVDCLIPARQAWRLVSMSGGERGEGICVFLIMFWMIFEDVILKASDVIHVSRCKFEGFVMSCPVHSRIAIKILDINIWTVIVCLVMHRITCLEYK